MTEVHKININSKYIIVIEEPLSYDETRLITNAISRWWNSDDKFLVLFSGNRNGIRLEKIDEDSSSG